MLKANLSELNKSGNPALITTFSTPVNKKNSQKRWTLAMHCHLRPPLPPVTKPYTVP